MSKIVFLDLDGPLFPGRLIIFHPDQMSPYPGHVKMPDIVTYWKMDELAVHLLNSMHSLFPFETVISSSWRKFCDRNQIEDLFDVNGLKLPLAKDWCTAQLTNNARGGCSRASEIMEYVERHEIGEFLTIDDPWSGSSINERDSGIPPSRSIMVNPDVGFDSTDFRKLIGIISEWAGVK